MSGVLVDAHIGDKLSEELFLRVQCRATSHAKELLEQLQNHINSNTLHVCFTFLQFHGFRFSASQTVEKFTLAPLNSSSAFFVWDSTPKTHNPIPEISISPLSCSLTPRSRFLLSLT
ncbi:hypothetical protein VNO78_31329 [Psophocarpus tetragonolobus]|uniref:Uncharacterized protein n=1 Tax=Psophocarpus tetragonolobus TaxID=3891 RepID=A0AAN9X743_PSOTE